MRVLESSFSSIIFALIEVLRTDGKWGKFNLPKISLLLMVSLLLPPKIFFQNTCKQGWNKSGK